MTPLAIESLGVFTAVGKNAPETMSSLLTRVQLFDDLDTAGRDGEPLTGAVTPIPKRVTGVERLGALALYAIEECVASSLRPDRRLPLILAAPAPPDLGSGKAAELLSWLATESALRIDLPSSRVISNGRDGVPIALAQARDLIRSRRVEACLVAGVDSLIDPARLDRLMTQGRVRQTSSVDGFIPGEAAACLLLSAERQAARGSRALLAGLGVTEEHGSWLGEPPVTGTALSAAFMAALAEAGVDASELGYIAHDVSGEHAAFDELSLAVARLPPRQEDQAEIWGPATCTGEIGAAAGFVSLAMLAFYMEKGRLARPALASFVSEGRVRGAAVVVPGMKRAQSAPPPARPARPR